MKHAFIISLFLLLCNHINAQISKVYGYSIAVSSGARPEKGQPAVRSTHLIYATLPKTSVIQVTSIWINGKAYDVKTDKVPQSVVTFATDNGTETLVPQTKQQIIVITPSSIRSNPVASSTLKQLVKKNEVVVVYRWKGKLYYSSVKKVKVLPASVAV